MAGTGGRGCSPSSIQRRTLDVLGRIWGSPYSLASAHTRRASSPRLHPVRASHSPSCGLELDVVIASPVWSLPGVVSTRFNTVFELTGACRHGQTRSQSPLIAITTAPPPDSCLPQQVRTHVSEELRP